MEDYTPFPSYTKTIIKHDPTAAAVIDDALPMVLPKFAHDDTTELGATCCQNFGRNSPGVTVVRTVLTRQSIR